MHVTTKRMAFLGLLCSITVFLIILSCLIEPNTLFLLAGAAFCVGIAIREWGVKWGSAFLAACLILGLILAPNKIYCITFFALSLYLVIREAAFVVISGSAKISHRGILWWFIKYLAFNLIYIPTLIFFPKLLFPGNISSLVLIGFFAAGQIGILVYDKAYDYFQIFIWGKLRLKLHLFDD